MTPVELKRLVFGLIRQIKETFEVKDLKKAREVMVDLRQRVNQLENDVESGKNRLTQLETDRDLARDKLVDLEQRITALEG